MPEPHGDRSQAEAPLDPLGLEARLQRALLLGHRPPAVQRRSTEGQSSLPHLDRIQESFGRYDLKGVRATVGGAAEATHRALGSAGFAVGDRVSFGKAPDLYTAAHEAAHVVQQSAGLAPSGGIGRPADRFEAQAHDVAGQVAAGRSAEPLLDRMVASGAGAAPRTAVQLLAGDVEKAEVLARFGNTQFTVAEELAERDKAGGRPGQTRQVVRDKNLNNVHKVEFENDLVDFFLSLPFLFDKPVHTLSLAILSYLNEKVANDLQQLYQELAKLDRPDTNAQAQRTIFGRLEAQDFAPALAQVLAEGGNVAAQLSAQSAFVTNIWKEDFDSLGKDQLETYESVVTAQAAETYKEPDRAFPLGIGGTVTYAEGHGGARFGPEEGDSRYGGHKKRKKEVPQTAIPSGLADRPHTDNAVPAMDQQPEPLSDDGFLDPYQQSHQRGIDYWTANEQSAFIQDARLVLDMPVTGAGISGNAAELFNLAQIFGLQGEALREYVFGVMAYLVGSGAHSFHEVMLVARNVGIDYTPGSYRMTYPQSLTQSAPWEYLLKYYPDLIGPQVEEEEVEEKREAAIGLSRGAQARLDLNVESQETWVAQVTDFLVSEFGVDKGFIKVTPLSGGRTGLPLFRVEVKDSQQQYIFKLFGTIDEAETEVMMLRKLLRDKVATVAPKGLALVRHKNQNKTQQMAGLLMEAAPGASFEGLLASLPPPESDERATAIGGLEKPAFAVGAALGNFHFGSQSIERGKKYNMMTPQKKNLEVLFFQKKLEFVGTRIDPSAEEQAGKKFAELADGFVKAELPATAAHGDANVGNFIVDKGGEVRMIDVATMVQSLNRAGQGMKTGAADVGRFLGSMVTATGAQISPQEYAFLEKAFLDGYFSTAKVDPQTFLPAVRFYRAMMELVAIQFADPMDQKSIGLAFERFMSM